MVVCGTCLGFLFLRFSPLWTPSEEILSGLSRNYPSIANPFILAQLRSATASPDPARIRRLERAKSGAMVVKYKTSASDTGSTNDAGYEWMDRGTAELPDACLDVDARFNGTETAAPAAMRGESEDASFSPLSRLIGLLRASQDEKEQSEGSSADLFEEEEVKEVEEADLWTAWNVEGQDQECGRDAALWLLGVEDMRQRMEQEMSVGQGKQIQKGEVYGATDFDTYHRELCKVFAEVGGFKAEAVRSRQILCLLVCWIRDQVFKPESDRGLRGEMLESVAVAKEAPAVLKVGVMIVCSKRPSYNHPFLLFFLLFFLSLCLPRFSLSPLSFFRICVRNSARVPL